MANGVAVPVWRVGAYVPSAPLRFVFWAALVVLALTVRGWWDWRTVDGSEWSVVVLYSMLAFTVGYDVLCLRWNPSVRWRLRLGFHAFFLYLWGLWGWSSPEIYSPAWRFDAIGHALYSFAFVQDMYGYRVYTEVALYRWKKIHRGLIFCSVLVIITAGMAALWELIEYGLDGSVVPSSSPLQKGNDDSMLDIITMVVAAVCAIGARVATTFLFRLWNPNMLATYLEAVDAMQDSFRGLLDDFSSMREVAEKMQEEQRSVMFARMRGIVEPLRQEIRVFRQIIRARKR